MPYKHQSESYREGGRWLAWCDGFTDEYTAHVIADIRRQGFKARKRGDRVFVLASELGQIDPHHETRDWSE